MGAEAVSNLMRERTVQMPFVYVRKRTGRWNAEGEFMTETKNAVSLETGRMDADAESSILRQLCDGKPEITGYDKELYSRIKLGWDHVAKPLDSMGTFEEVLSEIGAIQGQLIPAVSKSCILVCCADNGIVEEGVSQSGQEITAICADNIANGRSSVAIMAKQTGTDIHAVDIGINGDAQIPNVRNLKVRKGTRNFLKEPAMTESEVLQALRTGMELVREHREQGYTILGIGEMGIGNTTTASAVTAALLNLPAGEVTGRGAGLDDRKLNHKIQVIRQALEQWNLSEKSAFEILRTVGGLDIACMAGICIGGALWHVPVVLDGFISLAAALAACRMVPGAREYLIASHSGKEPAMQKIEKELELSPVIYAKMALGEGTGAVLMLSLLKTANAVYESSCSFDDAGIGQYQRYEGVCETAEKEQTETE